MSCHYGMGKPEYEKGADKTSHQDPRKEMQNEPRCCQKQF